jgi:hypothetical protein
MRPDPRLINLHDRPLHPRLLPNPRLRNGQAADMDWGSVALACFFITALALAFFWLYGAMQHRAFYVPTMVAQTDRRDVGTTSQAPAPDMSSPAVAFADVPEKYRVRPVVQPQQMELRGPTNAAELKPRKRLAARLAQPLPPEAAQAYAAAPREAPVVVPKFDRMSAFGGF